MRKDLKTGMLIGAGVVAGAVVIVCVWPGASVESRLMRGRSAESEETRGKAELIDERRTEGNSAQADELNEPAMVIERGAKSGGGKPEEENEEEVVVEPAVGKPAEQLQIHVVSGGETLSAISVIYYGNSSEWRKIVVANPNVITDENRLRPGMRLIIPK